MKKRKIFTANKICYNLFDSADPNNLLYVLLVHANGFHKEIWEPVLEELSLILSGAFPTVVAVDLPSHGDSPLETNTPYDWDMFSESVNEVIEDVKRTTSKRVATTWVGVGHSMGGACIVLANNKYRILTGNELFDSLLLVEPIIFPPGFSKDGDNSMATIAENRRAAFANWKEVYTIYKAKQNLFGKWDDRALLQYVKHGFRESPDKASWQLKCPPFAEAAVFRSGGDHGGFQHLSVMGSKTCCFVVAGQQSSIYSSSFHNLIMKQIVNTKAEMVRVPGCSHFVVMERPDLIADLINTIVKSTRIKNGREKAKL